MTTWVGIDVGATKLLAVAVEDGRVVAREKDDTVRGSGPEAVAARVSGLVEKVASGRSIDGIGVGFAGLVDADGSVSSSIMLPGWDGFPLSVRLSEAFGVPVVVDNDANTAAVGEWTSSGKPDKGIFVFVTVGTGIGGALIVDGRLYTGSSGVAGEIGNMTIDLDGPECWCGTRGCLNMMASGSALSTRYLESVGVSIDVPEIARRAGAGDATARRVIEEGARALGVGLANVVQLLNPVRIAIGGGVAELGDSWLETVRGEIRSRVFREARTSLQVDKFRMGPETGAFGAAELARTFRGVK